MDDMTQNKQGGVVTSIDSPSLAEQMGVQPGDRLLKVNGQPVEDVIDVQYYAAEYIVRLEVEREGQPLTLEAERSDMQPLGLNFEHPTFDIDIRRCNNLCEFCFVLQMAPRFRQTLYIKDDDYRYSFLFGHYVTLTNLSEHDEWRIVEQGLSPLYVSVHATDLELRRKYLRNDTAPDIVPQMRDYIAQGVEFHTQVVLTPGYNDGHHLEKTIDDLASLHPGVLSVTVVPVGLTQHHKYGLRPYEPDEAAAVLDRVEAWQAEFRQRLGMAFVYPTDEWYLITGRDFPPLAAYDGLNLHENGLGMVRHFKDEWATSREELTFAPRVRHMTLATGTMFADTLRQHAAEFTASSGVQTTVHAILNDKLGESITCAGLLMGTDIIEQLKGEDLGDVVALPRVAFDHPNGVALDDVSPLDIAKALDTPVALVDLMGDLVDIAKGEPALYFHPQQGSLISPDAILRDGGWAVEKYL
jgi:putative radical SAM enzyme (TIGR03279 family)